MLGEGGTALSKLEIAVREFQARELDPADDDLRGMRALLDALEREFSSMARRAQQRGDHLVGGNISAASWISRSCGMSVTSAADRLQSLPKIAAALSVGEIGYQSASVLCHLRDQLGEKRELFDEEEMLDYARRFSVFHLRMLCRVARHAADPDGFFDEAEENYLRRRLHVSLMSDGMHLIDGVLDPECGAALRTALEALATRRGPEDKRAHSQRMHDALGELVHHAMDEGKLPRRNGVRPHVTVTTTLEGLKNEFGVPPADLELSLPISTRTLERIVCDSTISRVLLADSMVIDVGRATRVTSAPRRRGLRVRDRGCRFTGCDRSVSWSNPHHIIAWALVHEGGWQVIKAGREFRFLPPERLVVRRARGPGVRWAA